MKSLSKLLSIFTLFFTLMFSSTSSAVWTAVSKTIDGGYTYYVDFERIRKVDGYIHFWVLKDYPKPNQYGDSSSKEYVQGDCNLLRVKTLSYIFYPQPMGGGTPEVQEPVKKDWVYLPPESVLEIVLSEVCSR